MSMKRRNFLSQIASAVGLGLLGQQAQAANWKKLNSDSGTGLKWRKINYEAQASGRVQAVGFNDTGTLGDNTVTSRCLPVYVCGISTAVAVGAGDEHSLALLSDGTIRSWGNNTCGRLGNNSSTNTSQPVQVCGITNAVFVSGGKENSFAVLADGTVKSWGVNMNRELGDGTSVNCRLTPVTVVGVAGAVAAYIGSATGYALLANGCIMSWGYPACGTLGDNTTASRCTAAYVCCITNAVAMHSGVAWFYNPHALAVLADGRVMAWGNNDVGQLGVNDTALTLTPKQVCGISTAIAVATGDASSYALLSNGRVMAWGNGGNGEINDGNVGIASQPVLLTNVSNVVAISAGYLTAHALTADGKVYSWAHNGYGQFGDGTNAGMQTRFACLSNVSMMVAGSAHMLTI